MADEKKAAEYGVSKKLVKIGLGGALILVGLVALIGWWGFFLGLIKGCLGLFLVMAGLITIAIANE